MGPLKLRIRSPDKSQKPFESAAIGPLGRLQHHRFLISDTYYRNLRTNMEFLKRRTSLPYLILLVLFGLMPLASMALRAASRYACGGSAWAGKAGPESIPNARSVNLDVGPSPTPTHACSSGRATLINGSKRILSHIWSNASYSFCRNMSHILSASRGAMLA